MGYIIKGYDDNHKPFALPDIKESRKETKNLPPIEEVDMNYNCYKGIKITKRQDGRWQARFTYNKSRKYIYGNTQKECYEELK